MALFSTNDNQYFSFYILVANTFSSIPCKEMIILEFTIGLINSLRY